MASPSLRKSEARSTARAEPGARTERLKAPPAERRTARGAARQVESHARDLVGLACLGIAVFLVFVLVTGTNGGVLGGAAARALELALGRFAFLVPLAFLLAAVILLLRLKATPSGTVVTGSVVVLASLLVLVAGGFPPFGPGHDGSEFVDAVYRTRAGLAGEALYVAISRLVGELGVALTGWLGLVAGLTLLTGWTLGRMAERTRRAAEAVTQVARTHARRLEEGAEAGPLDDPYLTGFGPPSAAPAAAARPTRDLDDWGVWDTDDPGADTGAAARPAPPRPGLAVKLLHPTVRQARLQDAATEFPDVYETGSAAPGAGETVAVDGIKEEGEAAASAAAPPTPQPDQLAPQDRPSEAPAQACLPEPATEARREPAPAVPVYILPEIEFLRKSAGAAAADVGADQEVGSLLVETLANFGVEARVCGTVVGPLVTRYELQLAPGTKVSKVANLRDDLAYALATTDIRILAPIPGKSAVGVEVPNQRPEYVTLGDIYREFPPSAGPLMVWLGKDISGRAVYTDLTKMPHLLIAGTTGSGKSGCINCIISSVLLRSTPDQVRMVLIDPKKVELSHYERIPHLLVPVVTNMKSAAGVLANLVREMEDRYSIMELARARSLDETNRVRRRRGEPPLPYLLIVIDELADLMMVSPAEVEEYVIRLAQKARAVGIHLVVATQRPSADVITGMIKANMPSRIAFAVSSQIDSRVILDVNGAEALLGRGDMLFRPLGSSKLQRIQGAFITEEEIELLVTHWRRQAEPQFREELLQTPEEAMAGEAVFDPDSDDLLAQAAELVLDTGNASVSMLQRRLRVGYTRAGRLIDMLERRGIVGPYEGSKPRQVLIAPGERTQVLENLRAETKVGDERALTLDDALQDDELFWSERESE